MRPQGAHLTLNQTVSSGEAAANCLIDFACLLKHINFIMNKLIIFFLFFFLLNKMESQVSFNKKNPPPGTVWLEENYFLDKGEVKNIDYREYQYWVKRVYGEQSLKYAETFLDKKVLEKNFGLSEDYFSNPLYDDYPVVGISWEQAISYSSWRTERVCEMQLIKNGLISIHPDQTPETQFTFRKYLNGEYFDYKPVEQIEVAVYSLPSKKEWEGKIVTHNEFDQNKSKIFHVKKGKGKARKGPKETGIRKTKNMIVYDLYGNVAEMLRERGKAKGGSWTHDRSMCDPGKTIEYDSPANWLGFRNTCKIVVVKGDSNN